MTHPRTVLFGGTFDPIHDAHIEVAREVLRRFDVSKVLFVPAARPPHKDDGTQAPFEDRVRMVELACAGEPRFEVSRIEEGFARSYSILTIEKMLADGAGPLSFLIGADAFADIETWHRWKDVVRLVEFIVVTRPGAIWHLPEGAIVRELSGLWLPISSSEIRRAIAAGEQDVPVPAPVLAWVRDKDLYRPEADWTDTHLVTELVTLNVRAQGPAIAGIWLANGGSEFPMAGWLDFVVVVLGWWSAAILRLLRRNSGVERVHFMDGPYSVEVSRAETGKLRLRMFAGPNGGRQVAVGEADFRRFVSELAGHSRTLLDECRLREWWSADSEALELYLWELNRELALGGQVI